jgi:hypothetical protein
MAERKSWPRGIGKRAAELHRGGPDLGGITWEEVAELLSEEFEEDVGKWNARDLGRAYLKSQGLARWGVPVGADEVGMSVKEYGNYKEVTYTPSGRPRVYTYEQLVALVKVDEKVWRCDTFEATFWEQGYKDERANLKYVDGKATGTMEKRGGKIEQLGRIFARFVRRNPEPVKPTIHPIKAEKIYPFPTPRKTERPFKRYLLFGDPHFGFYRTGPIELEPLHDRRVLNIILQLAAELDPDAIKIGGDLFDFAELSKYITSPEYRFLLQPAINEFHWFLAQLRDTCPEADISAHEGNHDERLWRHQKVHSAWACELHKATALQAPPVLSVPYLVDMQSLGVRWIGGWPNDEAGDRDGEQLHDLLLPYSPRGERQPDDLDRARAAAHLRAYAGLHVPDGRVGSRPD